MSKDPAVLFYTSDFLIGCADLNYEERGQYITLICLQHQHGHLNRKTIDLNIPNISEQVLSKFSVDKNGNFFNKRLEKEMEKRKEHSRKQRENALKRWANKGMPNECDGIANAYAKTMPLENENENENINENKGNKSMREEKKIFDYNWLEGE